MGDFEMGDFRFTISKEVGLVVYNRANEVVAREAGEELIAFRGTLSDAVQSVVQATQDKDHFGSIIAIEDGVTELRLRMRAEPLPVFKQTLLGQFIMLKIGGSMLQKEMGAPCR